MKHAKPSRAWRPVRARTSPRQRRPQGVVLALVFNVCCVLLPLAGAAAFFVMSRDNLYAYQYSDAGSRAVAARIEHMLGGLVLLDFDRQRQWDDLVAMELMAGDVAAARGFLLSAREILPSRDVGQMSRSLRANASDAEVELAALELLTPGTRSRYEATVPLLSRRAETSATSAPRAPASAFALGDAGDFELLARAMLADANGDSFLFTLTGFGLGLAGDLTAQQRAGALALLETSQRDDYPQDLAEAVTEMMASAASPARFRATALANADGADAGAYENAAAAFQAVLNTDRVAAAKSALDEIGATSAATSHATTVMLLGHAHAVRDLARLRLIAQAGRDRAAAAAKRLGRDQDLVEAARGDLTMTRDLAAALALAGIAALGLLLCIGFLAYQAARRWWGEMQDDVEAGELVDTFRGGFRPL